MVKALGCAVRENQMRIQSCLPPMDLKQVIKPLKIPFFPEKEGPTEFCLT